MINRRAFSALLAGAAGAAAAPRTAWSQSVSKKTVFYASVGPELALHDVDVADAALQKRSAVTLPANIQYVWPHPSRQYLYVVSSNGGPGLIPGDKHLASALRIDPASGALTPHGEPQPLPSRPIHCCVDGSGEYLLTAFNHPSNVTVHRINRDGTLGSPVEQTGKPEDPGALKVFGFKDAVLSNRASVAPGNGYGFGPRHLDFHPRQPWVFVSVERQSQLHVYRLTPDHSLAPDPLFVKSSLAEPDNVRRAQAAGAIHVHPNGRFVYLTNRNSGTVDFEGQKVSGGGENSVAVFSIDQATGEPKLIQNADAHTVHLRTFGIDPSGRLLVAASILPMAVRDGGGVKTVPAALSVYRIGDDGRLTFARKYDVDTGKVMQFWSGMVGLG